MKVLIVEDSLSMRELLKSLVQKLANEIKECSDGDEALQAYAEINPDWVLMDVQMPRMDGLSATRQITAAFPQAKIVIVTDYDDESLRAKAQESGACAYVLKENLQTLRRLLRA